MITCDDFISELWKNYTSTIKQESEINELIKDLRQEVLFDHIAFRTFDLPGISINDFSKVFRLFDYQEKATYHFLSDQLLAKHFEHKDNLKPKIFISQLNLEGFSHDLRNIMHKLTLQIPVETPEQWNFIISGVIWKPITWDTFLRLKQESVYAAWVAVFGFRVNHFAVSLNALTSFENTQKVYEYVYSKGIPIDTRGGVIKGSADHFFEQIITTAFPIEVEFADTIQKIPSCYFEFIKRYPLPINKAIPWFGDENYA